MVETMAKERREMMGKRRLEARWQWMKGKDLDTPVEPAYDRGKRRRLVEITKEKSGMEEFMLGGKMVEMKQKNAPEVTQGRF